LGPDAFFAAAATATITATRDRTRKGAGNFMVSYVRSFVIQGGSEFSAVAGRLGQQD
jgi:hypothetical protein